MSVKEILLTMADREKTTKLVLYAVIAVSLLLSVVIIAFAGVSIRLRNGDSMITINGEKIDYQEYMVTELSEVKKLVYETASDLAVLKTSLREDEISDKVDDIAKYVFDQGIDSLGEVQNMLSSWISDGWTEWLNNLKCIARDDDMESAFRKAVNNDEVASYLITWGRNS